MLLYKINNNVYPDKNFNFTLSAEILGLAVSGHTHSSMSDVSSLTAGLQEKASVSHSHSILVTNLSVAEPDENDSGERDFTLNFVAASGANQTTTTVTGSTITLAYTSAQTGNVVGLLNANHADGLVNVKYYSGDLDTVNDLGTCALTMEVNDYD